MSLKDELRSLRDRLEGKRPADVVATMHRAVDELRASGAPGRVLEVGARAPEFALPDGDGRLAARCTQRSRSISPSTTATPRGLCPCPRASSSTARA